MKRRRQSTRLPRVTVLAWSKKDLQEFTQAVEKIVTTQQQLDAFVARLLELFQQLERQATSRRRPPRNTENA